MHPIVKRQNSTRYQGRGVLEPREIEVVPGAWASEIDRKRMAVHVEPILISQRNLNGDNDRQAILWVMQDDPDREWAPVEVANELDWPRQMAERDVPRPGTRAASRARHQMKALEKEGLLVQVREHGIFGGAYSEQFAQQGYAILAREEARGREHSTGSPRVTPDSVAGPGTLTTEQQRDEIVRLRQQRLPYKEIAVRVGVHPATVSKYANEMQALPFATRCDTSLAATGSP